MTLVFGDDKRVIRREEHGGEPNISDSAMRGFAKLLVDYLDRKGSLQLGLTTSPPEPPAEQSPSSPASGVKPAIPEPVETVKVEQPAELTVKQAAGLLGVSATTVRRRIMAGSLTARNAAQPSSRRPAWRLPADTIAVMRSGYGVQERL